jgi:hypothetical protein
LSLPKGPEVERLLGEPDLADVLAVHRELEYVGAGANNLVEHDVELLIDPHELAVVLFPLRREDHDVPSQERVQLLPELAKYH